MTVQWRTLKSRIYRNIGGLTTGIWHDDYWNAPHRILEILREVCEKAEYEFDLGKSWYDKDDDNNPCRKTWRFQITNPKGKVRYGYMVASGCGSVKDPLERYDVIVSIL